MADKADDEEDDTIRTLSDFDNLSESKEEKTYDDVTWITHFSSDDQKLSNDEKQNLIKNHKAYINIPEDELARSLML